MFCHFIVEKSFVENFIKNFWEAKEKDYYEGISKPRRKASEKVRSKWKFFNPTTGVGYPQWGYSHLAVGKKEFFCYSSCSGNWVAVSQDGHVRASGRRHGIPWNRIFGAERPQKISIIKYETQEPQWLPWETTETYWDRQERAKSPIWRGSCVAARKDVASWAAQGKYIPPGKIYKRLRASGYSESESKRALWGQGGIYGVQPGKPYPASWNFLRKEEK